MASLFFDTSKNNADPKFYQCLCHENTYIQKAASISLAYIFSVLNGNFDSFIGWICDHLSGSMNPDQNTRAAITSLSILLRNPEARLVFGEHGGVNYVTNLLKMHQSTFPAQVIYELCFCLWTLSFCEELLTDFLQAGTVPVLVEQVAGMPREKVVRVSLATLRNLAEKKWLYADNIITEMIAGGLPKIITRLQAHQWTDEDMVDDIQTLNSILLSNARELSTFERYKSEVYSGKLKWGVCHNEKFWRENSRQLEENDFELLKLLIKLLQSGDDEVVAIACFDIGEFVRFYPSGKTILKHLGGKEIVMQLIESPNSEIQRHALQCMSKIMVNKWEYVK